MLELIKEARDRKISDVKELKSSALPTVMYGAGSYAADVTQFLKKHGITVSAYCIDDGLLVDKDITVDGKQVKGVNEVLKQYTSCNLVIGFADYVRGRESLASYGITKNVYFIDAPNQYGFFDRAYIVKNAEAFQETYNTLQDEKSRSIFIDFINAKICGDPSELYKYADFNQYFSDPIQLTTHETFVDCGAYDGDTIASFLKNTDGKYRKIYAFEPETSNAEKLQAFVTKHKVKNIAIVNAGCWSSETTLNFSPDGNMASMVEDSSDQGVTIEAVRIDDIVAEDPVTYIKMDIEGAELQALMGAQKTIQRDHPKLAICAYHKPEDLITLPQYIMQLSPDYKLYLRHHQYMSWEMVLYALPV